MQAKDVERGAYFKVRNDIYKLKRKELIAVGTHSHTKLKFFAKALFGGGEKDFTFGHTDNVEILDISKKRGQIISIEGKRAQVMDSESYETFDAEITDDVTDNLVEGGPTSFIQIDGKIFIVNVK